MAWGKGGVTRLFQALLLLAACSASAACNLHPSEQKTVEPVTLAIATLPDTALCQIALSRGYFAAEGLDVTPHLHRYGKPALEDVLQRKADIATVAETPIIHSIMNGDRISVIATIATSKRSNAVVARRDRGIPTFEQLRGKTIAATLGTTSEFFLHSYLIAHGIPVAAVRIVNLDAESIPDALARGDVDAASTLSPYTTIAAQALGTGSVTFEDPDVFRANFTMVATPEFVRAHPGMVTKVLKALLRAEDFARNRPAEAQRIVADFTGQQGEFLRDYWNQAHLAVTLDQALLLSLEDESEWLLRKGGAREKAVPNYLDYLYLDGLKSVKPAAVTIIN
ncbi:NrtA/SsuA/CpmA family ABC transporter substrate-binding protein [Geomonas sp. Red875]|uniref:NrtA/SsuA/CpmA family ABC transporter substrate-binding protein n=1 Tax=Geomesophilobacter sediminis TaxID=2798584 RepID=A0A8J7S7A1_9BACT|nr:NrtA/SsuA/CpmA family ABC transporter substrate-binding protein [Geomesophilobacter sediminis]